MQDFQAFELIRNLWHGIVAYLPTVFGVIALVLIGWIIAKFVAKFLKKLLDKININKLGEKLNDIEFISKSNIALDFSLIISKFFYYAIMLFIFMIATEILNIPSLTKFLHDVVEYLPQLLVAGVMLVFGLIVSELVRKIIATAAMSVGIPSAKLIATFVFYFLVINVLISVLTQAGINTEFISSNISLVIGGFVLAFAIGYGLASRFTVANYLSSFYVKDKINIGDKVAFQGKEGVITDIGKSSLTIETSDNSKLIIPLNLTTQNSMEILDRQEE